DLKKLADPAMQKFIDEMKETMVKKDGVGLAGPQVGVTKRLIIVNTKNGTKCFINPEIVKKSWKKEAGEEGCLSVPGVYGSVKRSVRVVIHAYDRNGEKIKLETKGLLARIFQHEIDHLNGVLFIDKIKNGKNNKK
ncbi:MAG TPA: peptide deformylase, partial [Patescibacteria group bacterium]|nr:peptide deformylase [Patescibacteria group bacterium]